MDDEKKDRHLKVVPMKQPTAEALSEASAACVRGLTKAAGQAHDGKLVAYALVAATADGGLYTSFRGDNSKDLLVTGGLLTLAMQLAGRTISNATRNDD